MVKFLFILQKIGVNTFEVYGMVGDTGLLEYWIVLARVEASAILGRKE